MPHAPKFIPPNLAYSALAIVIVIFALSLIMILRSKQKGALDVYMILIKQIWKSKRVKSLILNKPFLSGY
ncbi:hypothetical protein DRN74_05470 [Candidatus Micrarchaeota archaeon]|nr:MAG: hypothetical protein DRN74_05470 [Candidatus Micrarchaeota archaeon]